MFNAKFFPCFMLAIIGLYFIPECIAEDWSDDEDELAQLENYEKYLSDSDFDGFEPELSEDEDDSNDPAPAQQRIDFLERKSGLDAKTKAKICDLADIKYSVGLIKQTYPSIPGDKVQIAYDNCLMDEHWGDVCEKKKVGVNRDIIEMAVGIKKYLFNAIYDNCNYISPSNGQ